MAAAMEGTDDARVWEMYKTLSGQCEHFNKLESEYRKLASTWLLAAFGGIGFVLKDIQSGYWMWLIAAIAIAAAAGVFLLWLMDMMVYHRLLGAAFAEQLRLEKHHPWLPQVAHGMMRAHGGKGVTRKAVWFYIASFAFLVAVACVACVAGVQKMEGNQEPSTQVLVAATLAAFVLLGVATAIYMFRSATAKTDEDAAYRAR